MPLGRKLRDFWRADRALAFTRDTLWSIDSDGTEPVCRPARVALDRKTRRVLAVGDQPAALGAPEDGIEIVEYVRHGGLPDFDVAEAAFRHVLREHRRARGFWRLAPRVFVPAPSSDESAKRAIKDALTHAGAREVIVIPRVMASAIGAGLDVADPRPVSVLHIDRDLLDIAVIARSRVLAVRELHAGADDFLREQKFLPTTTPSPLLAGWKEHYVELLASLAPADAGAARAGEIVLCGPPASALRARLAESWGTRVGTPPRPDATLILGCRAVLPELDSIFAGL